MKNVKTTMKNYFCCHKVEEEALAPPLVPPQAPPPVPPQALPPVPLQALPPAPPQALPPAPQALPEQSDPSVDPNEPTDSSETIISDDYHLNSLFGNYTDVASSPDASPDHAQLPPPQLANPGVTFTWQEIIQGTLNLRKENFLGGLKRGDSDSPKIVMYRCDLPRINMVGTVKIRNLRKPEDDSGFEKEVAALERANHQNVIRLLGKCVQPGHHFIVYEFMPRGILEDHLFAPERPIPALLPDYPGLNWERRMNIALGVAQALVYVHNVLRMVHRDVSIRNVSLDENFVPKLTDFGLAVPILVDAEGNEIHSDIDTVMGTPGCIAPETRQSGLVWTKSDVFSYGVFLYQLFTGDKAYDPERPSEIREITDWFSLPVLLEEENYPTMIDPALDDRFSVEGLNRIFETARQCTNDQANGRPGMSIVEEMVRQSAEYVVPE